MRSSLKVVLVLVVGVLLMATDGCEGSSGPPQSASGVSIATENVPVGADGLTMEQANVKRRLRDDNKPGAIKHLYVISAWSGDVLIYSTVKGKVTSGGKRLTPTMVAAMDGQYVGDRHAGFAITIGGHAVRTPEVLQDDGTYGTSGQYLYWWDTRDVYHQHYLSGGQIVHVSGQPMVVPKIIINMDDAGE